VAVAGSSIWEISDKYDAPRNQSADLGTEREITLRTAVRYEVPSEIITVLPTKQWTHAGHPCLSGKVQSSRLDQRMREGWES
jgi:hypothetical protein